MNESLTRHSFDRMNPDTKKALMESMAKRYQMQLLRMETFHRWGQSCTTGVFEKNGREFVFIPGDTITVGWNTFLQDLTKDNEEELNSLFEEMEYTGSVKEFIQEDMMEPHSVTIGPMLAGRVMEEIGLEEVPLTDSRIDAEWLAALQDYEKRERHGSGLTLNKTIRFKRSYNNWKAWLYHSTDYHEFKAQLQKEGLYIPTYLEWAYLCGGGCRTIFPWGDKVDYSMRLYWFEGLSQSENKVYELEEPNFFGLSIAFDPYMNEIIQADQLTTCGGDGGCSICGGCGPFVSYLPCSPHRKPEVQESNIINSDYHFYRPIIRIDQIGL